MIGYFSANVPSGLGLYWMTSNVFSVAGSLGAKAYLKQNPPKLDVELKELGIDDESAGVKIPATLEEALVDGAFKCATVKAPIRPGIAPYAAFLDDGRGRLAPAAPQAGVLSPTRGRGPPSTLPDPPHVRR